MTIASEAAHVLLGAATGAQLPRNHPFLQRQLTTTYLKSLTPVSLMSCDRFRN